MSWIWDKKATREESIKTLKNLLKICKGLDSLWYLVPGIKYALKTINEKQLNLFKEKE